jgi:hypothetical protein
MTPAAAPAEALTGLSAVVREANREAYVLAVDGGAGSDEELDLACGCGRPTCGEHEAYVRVHRNPERFVVFPGHADRSRTDVVERGPLYDVVRAVTAGRSAS